MDTDERAAGYWITAVVVVLAITAAVWWYTAVDTLPSIPNTGATSSPLQYVAE
ncbi:MAG: hypothetical protein KBD06_01320 [Candidatus Pacebacteria bacterium]|nr:hypothetical protein [Candidatus Paceibacterota bacterium]